jgi:hypothetical protein
LAVEGDAKRKYFEHAGALLTADGSDDDKIKLESAPKDYKLDLAAAVAARAAGAAAAPAESNYYICCNLQVTETCLLSPGADNPFRNAAMVAPAALDST